jgi:pimeloyl-ACP methyl ester carboxylesterase
MTEIVVFLPGIMGSELRLGDERIWPGSALSLVGAFTRMEDLLRSDLVPTDVIRRFSVADQYQALINDLQSFGFEEDQNLFLFPYDWRKSNAETAERLAERLDRLIAENPGAEITILAHSMGGLVSRQFLESGRFNRRTSHGKVRRLIMLATPQRGAPLALAAAMGKEKRLFLSAEQVHQLASDTRYPSLYQLLPPVGEPFAWDGRFGQKLTPLDIYDSTTASALGLVQANLDAARMFWEGLGSAHCPQGVRYFMFYGSRQTTISAASLDLDALSPSKRLTSLEIECGGDGTVPVWSGIGAGFQGRAVGGEHGSIYKNGDLRRALATLFGYSGSLAAAPKSVEVAVRDRVVEPEEIVHVSLSLGVGVSELRGVLRLERAKLGTEGQFEEYVSASAPQSLSYAGVVAEQIAVALDAPFVPGLYRLSFVTPTGTVLGSDEFFVQLQK